MLNNLIREVNHLRSVVRESGLADVCPLTGNYMAGKDVHVIVPGLRLSSTALAYAWEFPDTLDEIDALVAENDSIALDTIWTNPERDMLMDAIARGLFIGWMSLKERGALLGVAEEALFGFLDDHACSIPRKWAV